ncbi:MAG TPA: hypothetical protein PLT00_13310 [Verrucomicrobiota bacterium]|nr:hypothetical protein [Verrucomicrobiota bacterium]HQB17677.1 hypothetical protein [Verrucomicrobiota bacterium]
MERSANGQGRHRFLTLNSTQTARVREAIVQLSIQPPLRTK